MKSKKGQLVQDYLGYIILAVVALIVILGVIFVYTGKLSSIIDYFKQIIGFR